MRPALPVETSEPVESEPVEIEVLFREHAVFVARFVRKLGAAREEVDDVVQDVFLVAYRHGPFIPRGARPTTWLARIAVHVMMAQRRNRRARPHGNEEAVAQAKGAGPDPEQLAVARNEMSYVQRALATLDLEKRAIFILFELEGESTAQIAAGSQIPIGTVYSRLHAARRDFLQAYSALTQGRGTP